MFNEHTIKSAPDGAYKFLRMSTGEWRFWSLDGQYSHKERAKGEPVAAAGLFTMWRGGNDSDGIPRLFARMEDSYSSSLGIGCKEEDFEALDRILGVHVKARWED